MASFSLFLHIFSIVLLTFCSLSCAQNHRNISLGSSLAPLRNNTSWLSPSGDFAFGFRPLDTDESSFLLAVWFDKIESKTVVWYAIQDKEPAIVKAGASVELTTAGELVLKDQTGILWSANSVSNASYAAMLDTGEFILVGANRSPRWTTFQEPRDTMLPSQVLTRQLNLQSRLLDTDFSNGRFKLSMQADGNLVLYAVNVPSGYQYDPYWASNTVGNGTQLIFNQSAGTLTLDLNNNTEMSITSTKIGSTASYYQRATLDPDGVFRHYVHPKNHTIIGGWTYEWTSMDFQPKGICTHEFELGSGICGFNSYCKTGGNASVDCECAPQYSFIDLNRKYKGCKPDFAPQNCEADESTANQLFEFKTLTDVDWPLSDYELYNPTNEEQCRNECLIDCFCAVAIFRPSSGTCWKKKLPLSNGQLSNSVDRRAFLKVPRVNNTTSQSSPSISKDKEPKRTWILVGSLFLGGSVIMLLLAIFLVTYSFKNKRSTNAGQSASSFAMSGLRSFTYGELEEGTNGFRDEVGRGASAVVYKGTIVIDEAMTCVAVKKLDKVQAETEKEFTNEMQSIGRTYHKNLVRLVGFCCQGTHRLLVYEFMSNGSLVTLLTGDARPSWDRRVQVAFGIARGLLYLHEECINQIIHCDIKPQNVLLDEHFVPRISDFGLAKLLKTDQTRTRTDIRGTKGYVAPEWFRQAGVTTKVDVYSFGVMLLEIICCRRNVELELGDSEEAILTDWVNDRFRDGRLDLVVGDDEEALLDMRRLDRFVKVALWCIQEEPSMRPTMLKVTQMLDGAVPVPIPPEPSSYISSLQ
ncbi:G-type lectin S-receptor-like serine/threonine-protein kinase LECRK3 [Canna indica]|uniref:Receptor-like serine/threonine-protein kinase n=1 Tax=Canna indica TaxID=4628 RepID=A0AAQ3PX04_9LILI|nr:G-type lectin S-receptor-like serine/threonine-protein kinase LECRK3 [Canna indica]